MSTATFLVESDHTEVSPEDKKKLAPAIADVLKANPNHDERGRFSTHSAARFVSLGGAFAKSNDRQRQAHSARRNVQDRIPINGADHLSVEENKALMAEMRAEYKTNPDFKGAVDVVSAYVQNQTEAVLTRKVAELAFKGATPDQVWENPKVQELFAAVNSHRHPDYFLKRDNVDKISKGADGYYKTLRARPPNADPIFRGASGSAGVKVGKVIDLVGPTAFSHSKDIAMSYSTNTLFRVAPGSKTLPARAMQSAGLDGEAATVPAFYNRASNTANGRGGYSMSFDSDRELIGSGRFTVTRVGKVGVEFVDALTGKIRRKQVTLVDLEQTGMME